MAISSPHRAHLIYFTDCHLLVTEPGSSWDQQQEALEGRLRLPCQLRPLGCRALAPSVGDLELREPLPAPRPTGADLDILTACPALSLSFKPTFTPSLLGIKI